MPPIPRNAMEWFALLGCITFVWIIARLAVKIIYRLVCRAIAKREAQNSDDNHAEGSDSGEARKDDNLVLRKLVVLAELISEGNVEPAELKILADELLEDELLPQLRRSIGLS